MPPIIEVRDLSKRYELGGTLSAHDSFRELMVDAVKRPWRAVARGQPPHGGGAPNSIWALEDVDFEVEQGDVVGIVGANGAGKSTLLKILSRITDPTRGYARLGGRLASLLEVGTGFHPELTGRENVFLNGAILGMRRAEIQAKFDEIVAFAEIERFLDTPVKRYSSGMYVRLAFAVAAHLEPEILVVDEVLAVGDIAFQRKCLGRMSEVSRGGRTVLFVSHNMAAVENLCRRGILLARGRVQYMGSAKEVVEKYLRSLSSVEGGAETHVVDLQTTPTRSGRSPVFLRRLELFTGDGHPVTGGVPIGAPLRAHIYYRLEHPTANVDACLAFDNVLGQRIFTAHSLFEPNFAPTKAEGELKLVCEIPSLTLVPGEYRVKVALDIAGRETDAVPDATRVTVVQSDYYGTGKVPWNGIVVMKHRWYTEP